MPEVFDPYHVWLGIPPHEQPPHHYRLLGVRPLESDADAIANAADQRMAHLRTFQTGRRAKLAEKLLNQMASARVCLLNPDKKAAYDRQLRSALSPPPARTRPASPPVADPSPEVTIEYHPRGAGPESPPKPTAGSPKRPPAEPPAKPPVSSKPLRRLGEYQLLEKLGKGGMGTVFKALHTKLQREVALKVLPKGRVDDAVAVARFEREMMAVGRLDHPNVVRAYDAREIGGECFLVMELVEGLDLNQYMRRHGVLQVADACEVIRQAALGLQSAHEHGLVHRDVKPSNLMLNHSGEVKLLDLGLARFQLDQAAGDEMTSTGHMMGTADFMAPEQVSETHTVDIRADVYSLGCTLYKLLAGRAPFSGSKYPSAFEKMRAHLDEAAPPLRKYRRDVPEELLAVINRMMAKEPAARFDTPARVADAIGPLAGGSDLPSLLSRAGHQPPPVVKPGEALEGTAESSSAGLTRFLRTIGGGRDRPGARRLPTERQLRTKRAVLAGTAVVGVLLALVMVIWAINSGDDSDGTKSADAESADEKTGKTEEPLQPVVRKSQHLVLQWPREERADGTLVIDGRVWELSDQKIQSSESNIKVPLDARKHKIVIDRRGFEPFDAEFTIVQGEDLDLNVVLKEQRELVVKPPVPAEEVQKTLRKLIEERHADDVTTKEKRTELARALLQQAEIKEASDERYVLLDMAQDLAIYDADETLMMEAVEAIKAEFEVNEEKFEKEARQRLADRRKVIAKIEEERAKREGAEALAKAQREREQRYQDALEPAETKVRGWDFRGGLAALTGVRFDDDPGLAARLEQRRVAVERLATFKERLIARINAADPPLTKSMVGMSGLKGDLTRADDTAVTATLGSGKTESREWKTFGHGQMDRIAEKVIDRDNPQQWLTLGILAFSLDDTALAERYFIEAAGRGVDVKPFLAPLAAAILDDVFEQLKEKQFTQADKALTNLQQKYARLPWYQTNQPAITAAGEQARAGIHDLEAEQLYQQAAEFFQKEELFDVRPLVRQLQADYPTTPPVTETTRKPSFAEMETAVGNLGQFITVCLDGKGDHKSIQQAIDAAGPNSLIEIQDDGPYNEKIVVGPEKAGLTLRGKTGCWPVITSAGPQKDFPVLVEVQGAHITLERLVLHHGGAAGASAACLKHSVRDPLLIRSCILSECRGFDRWNDLHMDTCVVVQGGYPGAGFQAKNSIWIASMHALGDGAKFENVLLPRGVDVSCGVCDFKSCTIGKPLAFGRGGSLLDCILPSVECTDPDTQIQYCDVFGTPPRFINEAKPGKGCFSAPPMFRNLAAFDFHLLPGSPCIGKASDGGDIGVRYTPEMIEMCERAWQLKQQGVIQFEFKP